MASVIDYNAIAASVYQTVLGLNNIATSLVGLDCAWCRLLPYDNGEDVIIQEYTLHSYECPKLIKVITTNTDYQIGNYMVDLWGVHSEIPLEINIDIETWKQIYGNNTMPQKGDFVLFSLLHKAFEVKSSTIVYTVGELATSYKCVLGTWQHNANRKESEEFTLSINEITESLDRLFGDIISKEVADAVVEVETSFNNTTYVDSLKTFDPNSVIVERLLGKNGCTISDAYYDFSKATYDVTYNVSASYDKNIKENHWIFSCWFKSKSNTDILTANIKIKDPYIKDKEYWWFDIQSELNIEDGDEVTIYRGGVIKINGNIEVKDCKSNQFVIKIATSDCLLASNKVSNWWKYGNWKILKHKYFNIITGYNDDSISYKIVLDQNNLIIRIGLTEKKIIIADGKSLDYSNWNYLAIDMDPSQMRILIIKLKLSNNRCTNTILVDKTIKNKIENFSFNTMSIENEGNDLCMCNIRLYESEYAIEDTYLVDMYSDITRNASKLILVDKPLPSNNMTFITPLK